MSAEKILQEADPSIKEFDIQCFYPEPHEPHLSFLVWYQGGDGKNRWADGTIDNPAADTAKALTDYVLSYQTPFVRDNWFRIEVSTPQHQAYGKIDGGYGRMLVTRELPAMVKSPRP